MRNMNRRVIPLLVLACLLALAGCASALQTPYATPAVDLPGQWKSATASAPVSATGWSRDFGDPDLDRLVDLALARNNNLAAAALRVRQAQIQAGLSQDALNPTLSATGSLARGHHLRSSEATRSQSLSLSASYQVDLWGKLAGQRDAAVWEARATEEDRQSTVLSLAGTTIDLYWQIAYLNERLDLSQESIAYARKTLELARAKRQAGAISGLEAAEAEQSLASQEAGREDLLRQLEEAHNALAVLFDQPPGRVMANPQRLPRGPLPEVAAGLPAELLSRRPDLRAAELRLRESLAGVDVAKASFYPALALTGELGASSTALRRLLQDPIGTVLAEMTLPFLQYNQLKLTQELAQSQYDEAVVNFRQTLYQALVDVENALSARQRYAAQGVKLEQALRAARQAESLYEVRYRSGQVALQSWLDAQETRRAAEVSLAQNRLDRLNTQVSLYLALGGAPIAP